MSTERNCGVSSPSIVLPGLLSSPGEGRAPGRAASRLCCARARGLRPFPVAASRGRCEPSQRGRWSRNRRPHFRQSRWPAKVRARGGCRVWGVHFARQVLQTCPTGCYESHSFLLGRSLCAGLCPVPGSPAKWGWREAPEGNWSPGAMRRPAGTTPLSQALEPVVLPQIQRALLFPGPISGSHKWRLYQAMC